LRLNAKVSVDESTHKVRQTKVEFKLKKQAAANWSGLTLGSGSKGRLACYVVHPPRWNKIVMKWNLMRRGFLCWFIFIFILLVILILYFVFCILYFVFHVHTRVVAAVTGAVGGTSTPYASNKDWNSIDKVKSQQSSALVSVLVVSYIL
jgi:hypothetical protein